MIKRILVGLADKEHARSATEHAIELAKRNDATLTGIVVLDVHRLSSVGSVPLGAGDAAWHLIEHRKALAEKIAEEVTIHFESASKSAGITAHVHRDENDPYHSIMSLARYHDLMVFGLKSLFEHGVVEEPPNELIRLVEGGVRPIVAVADKYREIHRVLIAYSGSMESAKTMRRFVQLALWPNLSLRIVTFDKTALEATELLEDAAAYFRAHGLDPEVAHVDGSPKRALLPYAEQFDADLIVLGNSSKNLLSRRIFGETALYAMQHSDRPLFLCQ
jgi:nucleotide-binding universal stress UspA family protein